MTNAAWLHSYVDFLLGEPQMSDARFELWCKAIRGAMLVAFPVPTTKPLPEGVVRMVDPRWMTVDPLHILFAAAAVEGQVTRTTT